MANSSTVDRIMDGDIPPLNEVTAKELSGLITLLQAFHLGVTVGKTTKAPEAQYDLFARLKMLKEVLSDTSQRGYVKSALLASWPKPAKSRTSLNKLSIVSSNTESTAT